MRNAIKPMLACRDANAAAAVQDCVACVGAMAAQFRQGWLRAIGAPDYPAYLAHHARRHPDTVPLSERDCARKFIEHRYGRGGAMRCC